jgi:hypothetical protein
VNPLDLGTDISKSGAGSLRRGHELLVGELAKAGHVALNEKFRHFSSFVVRVLGPALFAAFIEFELIRGADVS